MYEMLEPSDDFVNTKFVFRLFQMKVALFKSEGQFQFF